jgi:enamine deaminase RidA (YjgF/YER057c/UK114 family)
MRAVGAVAAALPRYGTLVEISRLASDDFLVEIEAVALLPG